MTIPDQQTRTTESTGDVGSQPTGEVGSPTAATAIPPEGVDPAGARTVESAESVEPSTAATPIPTEAAPSLDQTADQTQVPTPTPQHAKTEESAERSLFAENALSGFRSRWDDVQSSFVDDPKDCVHKADGLVSEVVEQLTNGFSEARSRLEAQWARGEEASTEDLRLALKRYRDFFQRLLSV
jgi:hypothetical protein